MEIRLRIDAVKNSSSECTYRTNRPLSMPDIVRSVLMCTYAVSARQCLSDSLSDYSREKVRYPTAANLRHCLRRVCQAAGGT